MDIHRALVQFGGPSAHALTLETPLRQIREVFGESALMVVIMRLERDLQEPFPEALLDQVDLLGELIGFAQVIRSRAG